MGWLLRRTSQNFLEVCVGGAKLLTLTVNIFFVNIFFGVLSRLQDSFLEVSERPLNTGVCLERVEHDGDSHHHRHRRPTVVLQSLIATRNPTSRVRHTQTVSIQVPVSQNVIVMPGHADKRGDPDDRWTSKAICRDCGCLLLR